MYEHRTITSLQRLVDTGQLRFIYVVGVARSASTIVARRLGAALDGAVYEPATPATPSIHRHFAGTILKAYERARARVDRDGPVGLAIKDLSLFLDEPLQAFVHRNAAHLVVTVRDPAAQQASLRRQLGKEFAPLQRVDAIVRHPFEALWMFTHFLRLGPHYAALAAESMAGHRGNWVQRAVAGWNIESWTRMERLLVGVDPSRLSVLDAAALRSDPAGAEATLAAIARAIAPMGARAGVEIAGHSRMLPRSAWAREALHSTGIAAAEPRRDPARASTPGDWEEALLAITEPAYRRILAAGAAAVAAERSAA